MSRIRPTRLVTFVVLMSVMALGLRAGQGEASQECEQCIVNAQALNGLEMDKPYLEALDACYTCPTGACSEPGCTPANSPVEQISFLKKIAKIAMTIYKNCHF